MFQRSQQSTHGKWITDAEIEAKYLRLALSVEMISRETSMCILRHLTQGAINLKMSQALVRIWRRVTWRVIEK